MLKKKIISWFQALQECTDSAEYVLYSQLNAHIDMIDKQEYSVVWET